jgi:hypothetical protein
MRDATADRIGDGRQQSDTYVEVGAARRTV